MFRTLANPHPLRPITSHFRLYPSPPLKVDVIYVSPISTISVRSVLVMYTLKNVRDVFRTFLNIYDRVFLGKQLTVFSRQLFSQNALSLVFDRVLNTTGNGKNCHFHSTSIYQESRVDFPSRHVTVYPVETRHRFNVDTTSYDIV